MMTGILAFTLFLAATTPAEVVVVNLPTKGTLSLALAPNGKAVVEHAPTLSLIHIEVDNLQATSKLSPAMNAYVVWTISPEGGFENVGELAVTDGKGRLDTVTRFDQFGILITAEPHYMVDRPNSVIAYRTQAPKSENIRRMSVSIDVGYYDYSMLQPVTASSLGLIAEARSALQVAAGVQADRLAESEYRQARIALGTVEEMVARSAPQEIILPVANESIRRSQRAFLAAREAARH
jgi:hypothetical protein